MSEVFTLGDRVVGLHNNGYIKCGEDSMSEIIGCRPDVGKFDAKIVAMKASTGEWKKVNGATNFNLQMDKFRMATPEEVNQAFPVKVTKAKIDNKYVLGSGFTVTCRVDGSIESNFNPSKEMIREMNADRVTAVEHLVDEFNKCKADGKKWEFLNEIRKPEYSIINEMFSKESMVALMNELIKFFIEFKFSPNMRFVNTLARTIGNGGGVGAGISYITNYFSLCNSPYKDKIAEKMKSPEFKNLMTRMTIFTPSDDNIVNTRLKVYFGAPGSGKTYKATAEADNRVIICNGSMLPSDLMEDFEFTDGKPGFNKSLLRQCIEEGKSIVLDEINLLNFEAIRFLQGLTDNKEEFVYKGETVKVADGFSVIGTMNLQVGQTIFGLAEPLVDRCSEIKEFVLTGEQLLGALL